MIEPEMAFYDLDDNMDLAEDFLNILFVMPLKIAWTILNFLTV